MTPSLLLQYTVRHNECDASQNVKLHFLLDYLQNIAAQHADFLGYGMNTIAKHQMLWVLSRLRITLHRMPKLDETITLETYPTGSHKAFATRQYILRNEQGENLVTGTSFWLLLNAENLRPLKPSDYLAHLPQNASRERFFETAEKIAVVNEIPQRSPFNVGFGDIDLNGHLNNAVYARLLVDEVGRCLNHAPTFKTLQINFNHAGNVGDTLNVGGIVREDASFYVDALPYFQAEGTLAQDV